MKNYKSNNNVVYSCKYHVVWCPKYRRKVLVGSIETRLKELIQETCSTINVEIIEMELMPDHVHLLMEVDPQFGIHKAVKQIKGRTSRILRQIPNGATVTIINETDGWYVVEYDGTIGFARQEFIQS